jgi:outer membrane receptor protein involved in Fe transport
MKFKTLRSLKLISSASLILALFTATASALQSKTERTIQGVIITAKRESVEGATITARFSSGERKTTSDSEGGFALVVPREKIALIIEGKHITTREVAIEANERVDNLEIEIEYTVPPVHETVVITASPLDPIIDRRNEAVYTNTLFSRDDQVFHTLDAGINAGQHEGGGKSLEIRRFGFNLDHGGVSGGLKVLVDNFQQNQATQGHGQGYLGQLKSLTPELVEGVDILNGPFSAEYGDFSGLGVVHIRLKESLPDQLTLRIQGGSFDTFRSFAAYSPQLENGSALIAYEGSRTDGPFINPLRYRRDNLTANYTRRMDERQSLAFKLNLGRNDFTSSGQIPLDLVAGGALDRFGFIDPEGGGRVRSGTGGIYYKRDGASGSVFKADAFVSRSLFDLYSNFTFFLNDPVNGDEIQQHDSRLQEGVNVQYLQPYKLFGQRMLVTAGANLHANQISVGLNNSVARNPIRVATRAHADVTNAAGYFQQGIDLLGGRLHIDGGVRYDYFRFDVEDRVVAAFSGAQGASRFQPKANVSFTPSSKTPLTLYFNYGRGIASQDARGVAQNPSGQKISTTDFYQLGASHNLNRFSVVADLFLIDRSNEQVYIPDDGSFEFLGPSRAYGMEVKTSVKVTRHLAFNCGVTRVGNAFFRGTSPRVYIDSAPHFVSNAALTFTHWQGFTSSIRYRHTSSYRLDGEDGRIRASGLDVVDFSLNKRLRSWVDFNLSIDNLANKRYFETQNFFLSRVRAGDPARERIHATPGYPVTATVGLTFHLFGK